MSSLIEIQSNQIKLVIESNKKLEKKVLKMEKKIKELNHILEHNTNIFDRDLAKVEETISNIYYKVISKKGNKRLREDNESIDQENK
jgi:Asp-tRNA(Asn)/Glu-tRNA(Gln) amidotransferase C subunit